MVHEEMIFLQGRLGNRQGYITNVDRLNIIYLPHLHGIVKNFHTDL